MKYDVEVLKKLINNLTMNIEMFQSYGDRSADRLAEMVAQRRYYAALVENDGVKDESFERFGNVFFDVMHYSAQAGADTSWWTKGT